MLEDKLSAKAGEKVSLNKGKPNLSDEEILEALKETYKEFELDHFGKVCEHWLDTP